MNIVFLCFKWSSVVFLQRLPMHMHWEMNIPLVAQSTLRVITGLDKYREMKREFAMLTGFGMEVISTVKVSMIE